MLTPLNLGLWSCDSLLLGFNGWGCSWHSAIRGVSIWLDQNEDSWPCIWTKASRPWEHGPNTGDSWFEMSCLTEVNLDFRGMLRNTRTVSTTGSRTWTNTSPGSQRSLDQQWRKHGNQPPGSLKQSEIQTHSGDRMTDTQLWGGILSMLIAMVIISLTG